jgi:hypothetical protein
MVRIRGQLVDQQDRLALLLYAGRVPWGSHLRRSEVTNRGIKCPVNGECGAFKRDTIARQGYRIAVAMSASMVFKLEAEGTAGVVHPSTCHNSLSSRWDHPLKQTESASAGTIASPYSVSPPASCCTRSRRQPKGVRPVSLPLQNSPRIFAFGGVTLEDRQRPSTLGNLNGVFTGTLIQRDGFRIAPLPR